MARNLKVTLIKSGINRPRDQKQTLVGLGLSRMNKTVVLRDTVELRGMIRKVSHLVRVDDADQTPVV